MNCISARETDKITDRLNCQLDQILGFHNLRAGKEEPVTVGTCMQITVAGREETLWLLL